MNQVVFDIAWRDIIFPGNRRVLLAVILAVHEKGHQVRITGCTRSLYGAVVKDAE